MWGGRAIAVSLPIRADTRPRQTRAAGSGFISTLAGCTPGTASISWRVYQDRVRFTAARDLADDYLSWIKELNLLACLQSDGALLSATWHTRFSALGFVWPTIIH